MTLAGFFIENNDKNNLLRRTENLTGILELKQLTFATWKILGFYWKKWKIDDFDSDFLIWSSKIPKGVCIYYERSIFWLFKKYNSFYLWLLELHFFDSEN